MRVVCKSKRGRWSNYVIMAKVKREKCCHLHTWPYQENGRLLQELNPITKETKWAVTKKDAWTCPQLYFECKCVIWEWPHRKCSLKRHKIALKRLKQQNGTNNQFFHCYLRLHTHQTFRRTYGAGTTRPNITTTLLLKRGNDSRFIMNTTF